jgi:cbb3-type cytochrome oxidase subunit 3
VKRWAVITLALYVAALVLLTFPVVHLATASWWAENGTDAGDVLEVYREWGYWVWIGFLAVGQAALLLVPLKIAERRLKSRRPVLVSGLMISLLLGLLTFAGLGSVVGAFFSDDGLDALFQFLAFTIGGPEDTPLSNRPTGRAPQDIQALLGALNLTLVFWVVWALIFWRFARHQSAEGIVKRGMNWLLRGSILEFLIAVPSHIIVRRREDCCAPVMTLLGLTTGLAVMLMCFGPGVFYLFVKRARQMQPRPAPPEPAQAGQEP